MVLVLHRRAGKTTAVLNHLQRDALTKAATRYAYIAPTYKQAKDIAWDILKFYARPVQGVKFNESELRVQYPNGSTIRLYGSENIDSLRGLSLHGGCQDESSQQPSALFTEVISKCLADNLGYWIWLGTPKGKNQFYRTKVAAERSDEHLLIEKTIDDTLQEERGRVVENLRVALEDDRRLVEIGEMTEDEFLQEWYCSFESSIRGAYYAKQIHRLHQDGRYTAVPYDETLPVHTVWDLGIGKNLAIGFYQTDGHRYNMVDYWEGTNAEGIPQAIREMQNKDYLYGKHFAPHDINTVDMGTGKTRHELAQELGVDFYTVPKLRVDDGIEQGRLFFSKLWVDQNRCDIWLDAISQYRQAWDEKRGMFIEKPYHDWTSHKADVHRYAALIQDHMNDDFVEQDMSVVWRDRYNQEKNKGNRYD